MTKIIDNRPFLDFTLDLLEQPDLSVNVFILAQRFNRSVGHPIAPKRQRPSRGKVTPVRISRGNKDWRRK